MAARLARQPLAAKPGVTASCWRQRASRRPPSLLPRGTRRRLGCSAQLQPTPPHPGAAAAAAGVTTASPAPPAPAVALPPQGRGSGGGGEGPAPPPIKDEPELALLLIACGIGLATGACIVGFNVAVHAIRDAIWQDQELLTSNAAARLREITETDLWPKVVFPPLLAGLAVGSLGWAIGGYEDRPLPRLGPAAGGDQPQQQQQQQQAGAAGAAATTSAWERWKLGAAAVVRPVSRAVAAAITLGSGASLGPEGPSVDIGKSVAQGLGSSLRSRQRHLTALIAAGSGAGVAAGFNAPISGERVCVCVLGRRGGAVWPAGALGAFSSRPTVRSSPPRPAPPNLQASSSRWRRCCSARGATPATAARSSSSSSRRSQLRWCCWHPCWRPSCRRRASAPPPPSACPSTGAFYSFSVGPGAARHCTELSGPGCCKELALLPGPGRGKAPGWHTLCGGGGWAGDPPGHPALDQARPARLLASASLRLAAPCRSLAARPVPPRTAGWKPCTSCRCTSCLARCAASSPPLAPSPPKSPRVRRSFPTMPRRQRGARKGCRHPVRLLPHRGQLMPPVRKLHASTAATTILPPF
jgi:hypothetical protein